jgi:uncharacterized protein (TIGR02246 family)
VLLGAALTVAACASPAPQPTTGSPADETTIRGLATKYAEAWNKGDVAAITAMLTEDYEAVGADGKVIKGRAAAEQQEKESLAQRAGMPLQLSASTTFVRFTSATSAAVAGTWTMAGIPAGVPAPDKGAWSGTFIKSADGQWLMATALVADFVPPPAMPPPPPPPGKGK